MELHHFFTAQRVLIVAGKGGVGKSAVAAALAKLCASTGLSTLLVTLDAPSIELPATEGLEQVVVTPGRALADYLSSKGMGLLSRQLARSGIVELVATTAPGLDDLLVLGRIKAFERENRAEVIIIDGPAAGHAIDLVRAPTQLKNAVGSGAISQQADEVLDMLSDPTRCKMLMVTTAAFTPVSEAAEVIEELKNSVGISLTPIVVNKCEPPLPHVSVDPTDTTALNAYEYLAQRAAAQQESLEHLTQVIDLPQLHVERRRLQGADLIDSIALDLADAIGELHE